MLSPSVLIRPIVVAPLLILGIVLTGIAADPPPSMGVPDGSVTDTAAIAPDAADPPTAEEPAVGGRGGTRNRQSRAAAPPPPQLASAGDMIGFSRELGDGVQAITMIDASRRWMAVYHVDQQGRIRLTSSRPLDADFTIQFNATSPLPEEIRRLRGN